MWRSQRRTAVATGFLGTTELQALVFVRTQPAQAARVWRLGGERFQQRLKDAERNNKQ